MAPSFRRKALCGARQRLGWRTDRRVGSRRRSVGRYGDDHRHGRRRRGIGLTNDHDAPADRHRHFRAGLIHDHLSHERLRYGTIRQDFELRTDGVVVTAPIACTNPYTKATLTDELVAVQTLRLVYYMSRGTEGKLPWTSSALYEWLKAQVAGIDIRSDETVSRCCEVFGGRRYVAVARNTGSSLDYYRDWNGLSAWLALLVHEARHVAGPGHVNGCPAFPIWPPFACDLTYDLNNLSSYGVEYWLFAGWATGSIYVGIGCAPAPFPQSYATAAARNANGYLVRFVSTPPPSVTVAPPYSACVAP